MRKITIALVAALCTAGCIHKDTSHALYLDPDGSLTWIVLDRHVRSDSSQEETRLAEESEYVNGVLLGQDAVIQALSELGATSVETRLLRDERPYWSMTEARFRWVDDMVERLLAACGVTGTVDLRRDGDRTTLEVVIPVNAPGETPEDGASVEALAAELEAYTIILTRGELVDATGFAIEGDTARLVEPDEDELEAAGELVLSLTWVGGEG